MTAKKPGTRIVVRGKGHSYYLDGDKVDGVTTILNKGVPKPQFIESAVKDGANWMNDHWDEFQAMSPSDRFEAVRSARWNKLREAGDRGREVHTLLHRWIIGETVTAPDDLAGYFDAGRLFVEEWQLAEVAVEVAVFARPNPELGRVHPYGGRFDLIGDLADRTRWLLDFKTSLRGVFAEYALQLAAYRYADFYVIAGDVDQAGAAVEHPMPPVDRAGVVHLRADGSYDLVPLEADYRALDVFTAAQELAAFSDTSRDEWIGDALRPPVDVADVAEAAA